MRNGGFLALVCSAVALMFAVAMPAEAETTMACPDGTYDMLDWKTLDSNLRGSYHLTGNANPLYTNMPLAPRCAKAGFPGSVIRVPNTSYQTYSDGTHYITQNLKQGVNQVWGPYWISLGGALPSKLKVLVASYRYNCDVNYSNCGDKEEYYLAQKYGLVQWVHYSLVSGAYQIQQKTVFNQIASGATTPNFPCF